MAEEMSRAEKFAKAKADADAAELAKKERGNYTSPDYEDVFYAPLETGKVKVFRFVGMPHTVRSEPTDPKLVLSSWITDDKKKPFICKWSEDRNWFLWKVFNDVMRYTWDKDAINPSTGKPGVKVYVNALKYPSLFNRVRYNGKEKPSTFEKGWNPSKSVIFNCISRDDYAWHVENKSYKLIAKKVNTSEDDKGVTRTYGEPGIGITAYDLILKSAVEEHGAWDDFDIAVRKLDADPWYEVYSWADRRKIEKDLQCEMSGEALTEEELSWKMFDLDKLNKVTSYRKILNRLGEFIKEVDACLKTKHFEELERLVAAEKAEWDSKKQEEEDEANEEIATPKAEEKKVEEPKVRTRSTSGKDMWTVAKEAGWKAIDEMKEKYSDLVLSITPEGIVYKDEDGNAVPKSQTIPCPDCNTDTHEQCDVCPKCGARF